MSGAAANLKPGPVPAGDASPAATPSRAGADAAAAAPRRPAKRRGIRTMWRAVLPPWGERGVGTVSIGQRLRETWEALGLWFVVSGPQAAEAGGLRSQQLSILLRRTPAVIAVNMVNSLILTAIFLETPVRDFVIAWMAVIWLLSLAFLRHYRRNRRRPIPSEIGRRPLVRCALWSLAAGLIWGAAAAVLSSWASQEQLYVLTFVIAGMAAGASAALAPLPPASVGYVVASLLPLLGAMLAHGGSMALAMAALGAIYLAFLMYVTLTAYWNVLEAVKSNLLSITLLQRVQATRKQLENELQQASNMQQALLPKTNFVAKMQERYDAEIDAYFKPSNFVGGDYWGMSMVDEHRLAVCIVDFSGHGVEAAVNTFRLHALLSQWGPHPAEPALYLEKLNKEMCRLLPTGKFATVLLGYVDTVEDVFCYAASGSTPPAVRLPGEDGLIYGDIVGLPVGITVDAEYQTRVLPLPPGAALILFSDALIETPTVAGDPLDQAWLSDLVCAEAVAGATEERKLAGVIAADFHRHAAAPPTDDLTVVSIERRSQHAHHGERSAVDWSLWRNHVATAKELAQQSA